MIRQPLFTGTIIMIGVGTTEMRFMQQGRENGLNSEYNKEKREFITKNLGCGRDMR